MVKQKHALPTVAAAFALFLALGIGLVGPLRWRAIILYDKATDRLGGVSWSDLGWILNRHNGIDLKQLAATRNPYETIQDPQISASSVYSGAQVFREQCSSCHGDGARGGPGGPSLIDRVFRQGRSDWALYQTITLGIPETPMIGRDLPRETVWDLVSYLKQTLAAANGYTEERTNISLKPVTADELRDTNADPAEWLMYSGSYSGQSHSLLNQINRENVADLSAVWERQLSTPEQQVETTPIVHGSTMFITEPPNRVDALDAGTGHLLWTYSRELPRRLLLCCGPANRGVALAGNRLYVGTLDAHLLALDAATGKLVWDVQVADPSKGYSITSAPLVVDDMIVTGIAGAEYGIRGFVDAYDAISGKRRWRFYTIPDAGQPGSETWPQSKPLKNGGASTWGTGTFDPELRLIYWGVGNPSLDFYGDDRAGDNLYSNSVVAIDADTGKLRWYFQFTPHGLHDWDSAQTPVLVDGTIGGTSLKLLAFANRNGFYYLLDRTSGKFLLGAPFVRETWATGLDATGRPRVRSESNPTKRGALVYPGGGATLWWPPSYVPDLDLLVVPSVDKGGIFFKSKSEPVDIVGEHEGGRMEQVPNENAVVALKAIEIKTGRVRWEHADPPRQTEYELGGVLSTAAGLIFWGDGESFLALDAETGLELWHFETGAQIWAPPVTYELAGRQYIAVAASRGILAFALPPKVHQGRAVEGN